MRMAFLGICVLGLTIGVSGQAPVKPSIQVSSQSVQVGSATVTADDIRTTFQVSQLPPNSATVYQERTVFSGRVRIVTETVTITADRAEQIGNGAFELSGRVVLQAN